MGRLIVLSRSNIQVVCGRVKAFTNNTITIYNDVFFPLMKKTEERTCILQTEQGQAEKLHLKAGAAIIATVKANEELKTLADGIYNKYTKTVHAKAYTVRYTGGFDFREFGKEKEQHVFCGSVVEAVKLKQGGSLIVVSWLKQGTTVKKTLYTSVDISDKCPKKGIFVTGPMKDTSLGTMYPLYTVSAV